MKQFQADRQTLQKDFEKSQINEEIFIKDIENFLDETNKSDKRRPGRKPALPDSHLTLQELLKRNSLPLYYDALFDNFSETN